MPNLKKNQKCAVCGGPFYSPQAITCSPECTTKLKRERAIDKYKEQMYEYDYDKNNNKIFKIPLTKGEFALIDEDDLERVIQHRWFLMKHYKRGRKYAASYQWVENIEKGRSRVLLLHRFILNVKERNIQVDHINNNPLDCRKSNLRKATPAQNSQYRKIPSTNTSGYKGVSFQKKKNLKKPWVAEVKANNKRYYLGMFATAKEAAEAYDKKARELHGEFAILNFPRKEDK